MNIEKYNTLKHIDTGMTCRVTNVNNNRVFLETKCDFIILNVDTVKSDFKVIK